MNTLKQSEMAACAESLGKIGDGQSADLVRKVCDHLTYSLDMSFRTIEQRLIGIGSMQLTDLFKAFHGWSSLGFKHEALSRLHELESKYYERMEQSTQQEFHRNLEKAENW